MKKNDTISLPSEVCSLSDWLITTYDIRAGFGLARYLGVSSRYNNHDAVRAWVYQQYQTWPLERRSSGNLKQEFCRLLPVDGSSF